MKIVSLYKFEEKKIDYLVEKGFKEIELDKELKKVKKVFIKPNLVTDIPQYIKNGANTDIRIIEAVIKYLTKYNLTIYLGEADSGTKIKGRKLKQALKLIGVYKLKKKYKFKIINLTKDKLVQVNIPKAKLLKNLKLGKTILDCDLIIDLPKIKTHKYATITCALKNMFGTIPDPLRIIYHSNIHLAIAELNKIYYPKTYVLTDGIIAMEGKGPMFGEAVNLNVLMFSDSMYCNDIVACKIMKLNPNTVEHLNLVSANLNSRDKKYKLIEHISLNKISKKFEPSKKNLFMAIEGKLMQHKIIVKIVYNEWVQKNITYHFRHILKNLRGGSSKWYIEKPIKEKNKTILIEKNN